MKTFATTKLTHAYLQKLDRQNYVATTFAVLVATCSLFWMLFHIGGDAVVPLFADLMYCIAASIGAVFTLITAYRAWRGPLQLAPRHQLAWLLVSVGLLADSIGGFYFAYWNRPGSRTRPHLLAMSASRSSIYASSSGYSPCPPRCAFAYVPHLTPSSLPSVC